MMNVPRITARTVVIISLLSGLVAAADRYYNCSGPSSELTDSECDELRENSTGCYYDDYFDDIWSTCFSKCNEKFVGRQSGIKCLNACGAYVSESCVVVEVIPPTPAPETTKAEHSTMTTHPSPSTINPNQTTLSPESTSSIGDANTKPQEDLALSRDWKVGAIVGPIVAVVLVVLAVIFLLQRYKERMRRDGSQRSHGDGV